MFKAFLLLCCLGPCAISAWGQTEVVPVEQVQGNSLVSATPVLQVHERRLALRAALVAQREVTSQQDSKPSGERQLNDRERAELRQQLRQQRRQ